MSSSVSVDALTFALNSLPHPIWLVDAQHRIVWLNDAFCQFFGGQPADYLQTLDRDCLPPMLVQAVAEQAEASLMGASQPTDPIALQINQQQRVVSLHLSGFEAEDAESLWVISLTECSSAELEEKAGAIARLDRLSNALHQDVFEGVWEIEIPPRSAEDTKASPYSIWWSPQFRALLGYNDETDFPNHLSSWIQILHPNDREWVLSTLQSHLTDTSGATPFEVEYRMYRKNGEIGWFRSTSQRLPSTAKGTRRVGGILRDITDRKQVELELSQQQSILKAVLDNIPYRIWLQDRHGKYLAANQPFCRARKRSMDQVVGHYDYEILPDDLLRLFQQEDQTILATGEPLTLEEQVLTGDGETRWYATTKTPMRDEAGQVIGIAGISMDITMRKQAEESIQQANERLEQRVKQRTAALQNLVSKLEKEVSDRQAAEAALRQSETELRQKALDLQQALNQLQKAQAKLVQSEKMSGLGQLVAGVAHEINNPINFVYGNLQHASNYTQDLLELLRLYQQQITNPGNEIIEMAERIDLDFLMEDLPKLVSSMRLGAERIQKIVASLRNFSRMDEAEFKAVNLHEGLDSTLLILQNRIKPRPHFPGVEIITDYGDLPPVECYASQMNQVFMNIISNAIDALEEAYHKDETLEPKIHIKTHVLDSNQVQLTFQDNGPGIPEAVLNRIFDPFFTTKPVGKGTGLGMSISYQIVTENHGGSLTCNSNPDRGATFTIEIPIKQTGTGSDL